MWAMESSPVQVAGVGGTGKLSNVVGVGVGYQSACAVSSMASGGQVYCWGANGSGQLGNGSTTQSNVPVVVSGLSNMVAVSVGELHACALSNSGSVYCWGDNTYGQLGNNSTTQSTTPVQVLGVNGVGKLAKVASVSAGLAHNCALSYTGQVYCWGYNSNGQLGNNTMTDSHVPVNVKISGGSNLGAVTAISVGSIHSCAIQFGFPYCWGDNEYGALGTGGSPASSSIATHVLASAGVALSGIVSIGASQATTCGVTSSNGVVCWGSSSSGQLGDNSTSQANFPVPVVGVGGAGNLSL
jgi:alpha-tubulin suppressor-like RCC1 family protein